MRTTHLWRFNFERPKLSLTLYFIAWKVLLLCIALASPSPGYDTSTGLALGDDLIDHKSPYQGLKIIEKLTRWDAIWFTQIAHDGYTYEQQWMAGWGFAKLLGLFSGLETSLPSTALAAVVGITIAHISHLLSTLVLYELSLLSLQSLTRPERSSLALLAASLHIISPAGLFLSAPYAESLFSLMTFSGFYLYGRSFLRHAGEPVLAENLFLLSSGLCLGVATTIRGNGLLSGLVFVYEAMIYVCTVFLWRDFRDNVSLRRHCVLLLTGTIMGCIAIFPHYLAYLEYCTPSAKRPWCSQRLPSIYAWVQSKYWYVSPITWIAKLTLNRNIGFLQYWTFANLPLFILAMPMLYIMCVSSIWAWVHTARPQIYQPAEIKDKAAKEIHRISQSVSSNPMRHDEMLRRLAIPQMALTVLAFTTYHVQIITRLSSAYPVWYWWLAYMITEDSRGRAALQRKVKLEVLITRWMVMYAIIQGGLFASFLPPA